MSIPVNSKTGLHNTRRRNFIIASLFVIVLVVSLCAYLFMANNDSIVHVKSETELVKAIVGVKIGGSTVSILDKDIDLTAAIIIPARKNITLTSNGDNEFKLSGADRATTLSIETDGTLILDGIVVTHAEGAIGGGVDNFGTFIMHSGVISGNIVPKGSGGGVSNSGVFEMYGGEIVNNVARVSGGGVDINGKGASFSMYGGEIYGNTADNNENIYDP